MRRELDDEVDWNTPTRDWGQSPHGGWTETTAKVAFVLLMIAGFVCMTMTSAIYKPLPTREGDLAAVSKAHALSDAFLSKKGDWINADLVTVRNGLADLIESENSYGEMTNRHIRSLMEGTVGLTLDRLDKSAAAATTVEGRTRAMTKRRQAMEALDTNPPTRVVQAQKGLGSGLWALTKLGLKTYLLFIPFACICLLSRMNRYHIPFFDELLFGWRRLVCSVLFWPAGMSQYPRDTALTLRRTRITIDYLARMGRRGWDRLTTADERAIDELVMAPKAELRAKLDAICEMPWHLLLRARMAVCVSMFIGFFLSMLSFGRGTAMAAEGQPVAAVAAATTDKPVPAGMEVHGYAQFGSDLTKGDMATERVRIKGTASPAQGFSVFAMGNLTGKPAFQVAEATLRRNSLGLRAGQIILPSGYQVPGFDGQRVIGGPESQWFLPFWRLGLEAFGEHRLFSWAMAYLPGPDLSDPSAKNPKELQLAFALPRVGPAGFMASVQGGERPTGFLVHSSVQASLALGPVDFVANGAIVDDAGAKAGGVSSFIGWRATPRLDLAGMYDRVWPASGQAVHQVRLQTTCLGFGDRVRLGIMGVWHSLAGFGARARLQFSF